MKANEFKKILKPLIEQTVREVLLQEGVLSNIVAEVVKGMRQPIVENTKPNAKKHDEESEFEERQKYEKSRQERIKRLNESTGMNIFDNVEQINETSNSQSPLSGIKSSDSGVDISAIQKLAGGRWGALARGNK